MYKLFIGLRYLRRRKIVRFSVAGVVIGLLVMIVVTSIMGGFARDLRDRIRGVSSHLTITRPRRFIGRYEQIIDLVKRVPHVVAASPRVEDTGYVYVHGYLFRKGATGLAQFIGIDMAREVGRPGSPGVSDLGSYLSFRRPDGALEEKAPDFTLDGAEPPLPGVLIGSELLASRHYDKGISLEIRTVKEKPGSMVPFDARDKRFTVVGRFKTRMVEYDAGLVYMPLKAAQDLLQIGDAVTHIAVRLDDYGRAAEVKRAIQEALAAAGPLRQETRGLLVRTWEENPDKKLLLDAVTVEKIVMAVVLFFIVIVAGFNIIAILTLIVDIKTRDIGILRALGATARGVSGLFLLNGALIGAVGSVLGVGLGLLVVYRLNPIEKTLYRMTGFRIFPPDVYYLDSMPTEVSYPTIALVVAASLVVSLLFSAYPAWKAARLDPVEAIRHE